MRGTLFSLILCAGCAVVLALTLVLGAGRYSLAGSGGSGPLPPVAGDVDCDGMLTIGDAVKVARALIGLPVQQAPGCPLIGALTEIPGPVDEMVEVSTDKSAYAPGETVQFTLRISNMSEEEITLFYGDTRRLDFLVTDSHLRRVWLHSHVASVVGPAVEAIELQPGESREFSSQWPQMTEAFQPVPPGEYLIFGFSPHCDERWPDEGTCRVWAPEPAEIVIE